MPIKKVFIGLIIKQTKKTTLIQINKNTVFQTPALEATVPEMEDHHENGDIFLTLKTGKI
jgi:hypothetical protein